MAVFSCVAAELVVVNATVPKSEPKIPRPKCMSELIVVFRSSSLRNWVNDLRNIQEGRLIIAHTPPGEHSSQARSMNTVMRSDFARGWCFFTQEDSTCPMLPLPMYGGFVATTA